MIPLWILGGGGHARVVIDTARSTGDYEVIGILDDQSGQETRAVDGVPVRGPITAEALRQQQVTHAIIAIGNNGLRAAIAARLDGLVTWATITHAHAYIASSATLGEGSVVFAKSVVQPGTSIGRHVILNTASTVDHDSTIADFVHIGPGCNLAGNVAVGEGTFLGIGSRVIPARHVGSWAMVGAGASVVCDLPGNVTAVGVPARVIKEQEKGWHLT